MIGRLPFRRKVLAALMVTLMVPGASMAQTVWNGGGGDSNWSTGANWVGGVAPPSSNTSFVQFGLPSVNFTPNANSIWTLNRLDISGATSYALTGSALTFDGTSPQINTGGAAHSIANDITLAATLGLTNNSDLGLTGAITGAGGLNKTGSGVLTLADAPLNTGTTTINAGTLQIGSGIGLGVNGNFGGPVVNNGALVVNNGFPGLDVALGDLSGTGSLTKNGTGALISLGPIWTHSGNTTINGGTVTALINSAGRLIMNGGTFNSAASSFGSLEGAGGTIDIFGGSLTVGGNNSSTAYSGAFANSNGTLIKNGSGTLTLAGAPQHIGPTFINAGTLQIGSGIGLGVNGTFNGPVVNNGALVVNNGFPGLDVALGDLSGTGSLTKNGTGALISLGPIWTHSGNTTINSGTVTAVINSAGRLIMNGGTFNSAASSFGSLEGSSFAVIDIFGGSLTVGGNNSNTTYSGAFANSNGTLIKNGSGTLTLAGAPQHIGPTFINAGTLQIGSGIGLGVNGTFNGPVVNNGALVVNNGFPGLDVALGDLSGTGSLTKNGTGALISLGPIWTHSGNTTINGGTVTAVINSAGRLIMNGGTFNSAASSFGSLEGAGGTIDIFGGSLTVGGNNSSTTYSGTFANALGTLVKTGSGTLILTGAPQHIGPTNINAGTLQIGTGGALSGSSSFNGAVVNNGTLAFDYSSAGGSATLGAVSGTGSLTKSGSGTLILTGAPGHTGITTINAGTLQVGSGGALAGSSSFGGAVVNNGTLAFNYSSAGGSATLGAISGTGSLTKSGSGTLILTGAPGHTGATTINAGTLQVGNGGALAGSSSFGGAVVNNGILAFDYSSAGGNATLGAVSGTGSLVKNGSGTLILTGTPGHTGTTSINAGTLQVGTGGALSGSSSFGGPVLNNSTLVFDYSSAGGTSTLSNLSGNGNLIKNGSGLLNLTGTSTNTGSMQVNAGTLAVNGAIASAVNINAGGTLGGLGTINNAVTANAGGVIAPGNSIGTLTVNGSVAFNAGSIYRVEVNPAGNADRINVIGAPGTATIGGGTVDVQAGAGTYSPATIYTIINATGGVAGTFSSVTSNLAFLTPSLAYDPNNVFLTLTRNAATFPSVALTPNQIAVSNMLEPVANAGPTGDMGTVVNGLLGLSAPQARAAFDAIGGASIVELRRANVAFARVFTGDLDSRIQQPAGAGVAKSGEQPASPDGRGFWIKANASAYRTDGDGNAFENEVRGGSIAFGADAAPAKDVIVGLAAAYGKSNLDFDGIPDSGWTRNGALAVYGNYETGPWAFKGIAGYAFGRNQLDRPIVFGPIARVAQGDFDSQSGTVYAEASYDIPMDGFSLRPIAGLSWVLSRQQGFTESGAGALNLAVTGETTNSLRTLIGVKTVHALPTGSGGVVYLEPRLVWSHEFGDLNTPLDAQLTGAGAAGNFTVAGVNLKRDSAIAGLRVSGSVSKDIELFADILVSGNSSQTSASAFAGLRMAW